MFFEGKPSGPLNNNRSGLAATRGSVLWFLSFFCDLLLCFQHLCKSKSSNLHCPPTVHILLFWQIVPISNTFKAKEPKNARDVQKCPGNCCHPLLKKKKNYHEEKSTFRLSSNKQLVRLFLLLLSMNHLLHGNRGFVEAWFAPGNSNGQGWWMAKGPWTETKTKWLSMAK